MQDYSKLVQALRHVGICQDCNECEAGRWHNEFDCCLFKDAADAIEALQAENPIVESVLVDKMRQQMEETVCHCNVKENAELIARILDDDVDGKAFEMPKRGEWVETEEEEWGIYPFKKKTCSVCDCKIDHTFMLACMDYFDDRDTVFHYCPNCGADMRKMEVQE